MSVTSLKDLPVHHIFTTVVNKSGHKKVSFSVIKNISVPVYHTNNNSVVQSSELVRNSALSNSYLWIVHIQTSESDLYNKPTKTSWLNYGFSLINRRPFIVERLLV